MSEPRILTINHGACEGIVVSWVRSRLNMGIEQYSKKDGKETIRIENLGALFREKWLSDEQHLHRRFQNLEYYSDQPVKMPGLRIFPIMDTERTNNPDRSYISGAMFDQSPFRRCIVPVYNIPNLDVIFDKAGVGRVSKDKPSSYSNILDELEVMDLYNMLKDRNDTNLHVFLRYCLQTRPEYQDKTL